MSELKPCPFCGGEAELEIGEIDLNGSAVVDSFQYYCGNCGIFKGEFRSIELAEKDWNTRTDSERIKELEEALMDVIDGYPSYDLVDRTGLSLERCQEIWRIAKGGNDKN
jgi:hypothetical protein